MYGRSTNNIFSRSNNTTSNTNTSSNIFNKNNNTSYGNTNNSTYGNNNYGNSNNNTNYGNYNNNSSNYSKLGSNRVPNYNPNNAPRCLQDINPKWKSSQLNSISIVSRPQTMHLSITQLRVEDYYLIRTNKLGKDEEKLVRDAIDKKHFNSDLMNSHVVSNLKQPVTFQEGEINLDTLKQLNKNRNIWGSGTGGTSTSYGNNSSYGNNNNSYGNNNNNSSSRNIFSSNNNNSSSNNNIFNRNNNNTSSNIFSNNNNNGSSGNIFSSNNNTNKSNIFGNNNNSSGNSSNNIFSNNNNNSSSSNNIFNRNNNTSSGGGSGNNIFNSNNNSNSSSNNIFNKNNNSNSGGNNIFNSNNNNNSNGNNIFSSNNNRGNNIFSNSNNSNSSNGNRNIFSNNNNNGYNNNNNQNNPTQTEIMLARMMEAQTVLLQSLVQDQNRNKASLNNNGNYSLFDSSYNPYLDNNSNSMYKTNPYASRFDQVQAIQQPLYTNSNKFTLPPDSYYDVYDYETAQINKSKNQKPYTIHQIPKKSQIITQFFIDKYGKDKLISSEYNDYDYQYKEMAPNSMDMRQTNSIQMRENNMRGSNMHMIRQTGMQMIRTTNQRDMRGGEHDEDRRMVEDNYNININNSTMNREQQGRFAATKSYILSQRDYDNNNNNSPTNTFYMLVLTFAQQGSKSVVQRFEKSIHQKTTSLLQHIGNIERWYNTDSQEKFKRYYHIQRIDITSVDNHQVKANVILTKVNLPDGYYFKPRNFDGFEVNNFEITNESGTVRWLGKVNIAGIDFSHGFTIKPNEIDCSIPQLNRQCIATFNSLPEEIVKLDPTIAKQMLENYFKQSSQEKITLQSFSNNPPEYRIRIKSFPEKIVAD